MRGPSHLSVPAIRTLANLRMRSWSNNDASKAMIRNTMPSLSDFPETGYASFSDKKAGLINVINFALQN